MYINDITKNDKLMADITDGRFVVTSPLTVNIVIFDYGCFLCCMLAVSTFESTVA